VGRRSSRLDKNAPAGDQPEPERRHPRSRADLEVRLDILRDYDLVGRRHRQIFRPAISCQRRLRAARQAERLRQHLPIRRSAAVLFAMPGGPCLSLSVSGAAASRSCSQVGAEGGVLGVLPGIIGVIQASRGGFETDSRRGTAARWPIAPVRRPVDEVPGTRNCGGIPSARSAAIIPRSRP
jgi:hypothetical protein